MAKKELKPSQIQAQIEAENAAALEALRRRREKEHRKMEKSKGTNKRVGKSWTNDIGIFILLAFLGLFMLAPIYIQKRSQQLVCYHCGDCSSRYFRLYGFIHSCKVQVSRC